jgi:hypothetical protein
MIIMMVVVVVVGLVFETEFTVRLLQFVSLAATELTLHLGSCC